MPKVRLTQSGGLAGLSMVADVDVDELPEKAAKEVRAALAEIDFEPPARPASVSRMPGAADTYQYDVVVEKGRHRQTLTAHEPVVDPGLRALLDALLPLARPE